MTLYVRLYDSMIAYYQRWYSEKWKLHASVVAALSMCTFFNLTTISNLLSMTALRRSSWLLLDDHNGKLYLLAVMLVSIVINISLAWWTNRKSRPHSRLPALPAAIPVVLVLASFVVFLGTLFSALAIRFPK